jgi:hypothetical protein
MNILAIAALPFLATPGRPKTALRPREPDDDASKTAEAKAAGELCRRSRI